MASLIPPYIPEGEPVPLASGESKGVQRGGPRFGCFFCLSRQGVRKCTPHEFVQPHQEYAVTHTVEFTRRSLPQPAAACRSRPRADDGPLTFLRAIDSRENRD